MIHIARFALSLALLAAIAPSSWAAETFSYKFTVGDVLRYKFTSREATKGESEITAEIDFVIKVFKKLPYGGHRVFYRKLYLKGSGGDPDEFRKLQILYNKDTEYVATVTRRGLFGNAWPRDTWLIVYLGADGLDRVLMPRNSLPPCWLVLSKDVSLEDDDIMPGGIHGYTPEKDGMANAQVVRRGVSRRGYRCTEFLLKEPFNDPSRKIKGEKTVTAYFAADEGKLVEIRQEIQGRKEGRKWSSRIVGVLDKINFDSKLVEFGKKRELNLEAFKLTEAERGLELILTQGFGADDADEHTIARKELESWNPDTRLRGLELLAKQHTRFGKETLTPVLRKLLSDKDLRVRRKASSILRSIDRKERGGRDGQNNSVFISSDPTGGFGPSLKAICPVTLVDENKLTPMFIERKINWFQWVEENRAELTEALYKKNKDKINQKWWEKNKGKIHLIRYIDKTFFRLLKLRDGGFDYFKEGEIDYKAVRAREKEIVEFVKREGAKEGE